MSKESYARGFCKAAEAAGVDPTALAKYAQQYVLPSVGPTIGNAIVQEAMSAIERDPLTLARTVRDQLVKVPVSSPHIKTHIGGQMAQQMMADPLRLRSAVRTMGREGIKNIASTYSPTAKRMLSAKKR